MKNNDTSRFLAPSGTVSFADVAHQTLIFDAHEESSRLILSLLDTPWVQRLRRIRQTGYTNFVYMFSEHSRFGHSLGVAYLANRLMKNLSKWNPEIVRPYQNAVAAAALLHDVGHVAPGSHLGERIWSAGGAANHEAVSARIIREDPAIESILRSADPRLPELVVGILDGSKNLPAWTKAVISGGGWNADRGNWTIVDSAMCSVTYGRYNVFALIDAFRITNNGELVLQESRLDALTHFYVARDSMYRQVYQHRVLQVADALAERIVLRIRDLTAGGSSPAALEKLGIRADETMIQVLAAKDYSKDLALGALFRMTDSWWVYHVEQWCECGDEILRDLCVRLRDRRLLKTVRSDDSGRLEESTAAIAREMGFDPRYYIIPILNADRHRAKSEEPPQVLLDSGELIHVAEAEPLIGELLRIPSRSRTWLAVPREVKERLGRVR